VLAGGCSRTRRDVEVAEGEEGVKDIRLSIKASLHWNHSYDAALPLQLIPLSSHCVNTIQKLGPGHVGERGTGSALGSEFDIVVKEWVERADVSPSWILSDAAFWCTEREIEEQEEQSAIPETPSPTKLPGASKLTTAKGEQQMEAQVRIAPSLATMMSDLIEQNSLLLVSVRALDATESLESSAAVGSSNDRNSAWTQLALLGGIALNGRVGFLQFVSEAAEKQTSVDTAVTAIQQTAAGVPGAAGAPTPEPFVSHMLEEWMCKQCDRSLDMGKSEQGVAAGTNFAEAAEPRNEDKSRGQDEPATRPEEKARSKLLQMARSHQRTLECSSVVSAASHAAPSSGMVAEDTRSALSVFAGGDGSTLFVLGERRGDGVAKCADSTAVHLTSLARAALTEGEALQQMDERYELLQTEYLDRNPRTLFEQVIPECMEALQKLHACSSSHRTSVGDRRVGCERDGEPGVDAGTVYSEEEDMGNRGDGKGPSGLKMNEQEGGQEAEDSAEARVADAGKDPRQVIKSHVTSNWIKKPKEWKAWVGKGVPKEVCKRRHEFQALLRLYLVGLMGKSVSDPLPMHGQVMTFVLRSALFHYRARVGMRGGTPSENSCSSTLCV
jgi:hypothetical protein